MNIRVADIVEDSIVDGAGIRLAVFVQGCPHHCPGCHNPATHSFSGGHIIDTETILAKLQANPLITGLTLSGGEPFAQAESLVFLAQNVRNRGYDVWCYTGYTLAELMTMNDAYVSALLAQIDVLVDGPYIEAERDLSLPFRGSRNQRLIDLPRTLHEGRIILWEQNNIG